MKKQTADNHAELFAILQKRFEQHKTRHSKIPWHDVAQKLMADLTACEVLQAMEDSGGEPDVIGSLSSKDHFAFVDCSKESPAGRRSLCFDKQAWLDRKENKPAGNALDEANRIGIRLLTEDEYRLLQQVEEFDLKTSSWIATPAPIRKLGGALFADRRYDHVFVYHNGAQAYYAARGFRGIYLL